MSDWEQNFNHGDEEISVTMMGLEQTVNSPKRSKGVGEGYEFTTPPKRFPSLKSRRGRVVSLDSAAYEKYKKTKAESGSGKKSKYHKRRTKSANDEDNDNDTPALMKKLSFQNMDLENTPLSSLRSCSEYNQGVRLSDSSKQNKAEPKKKSVWQKMFGGSGSSQNSKARVKFSAQEDSFYLQRFQFNEANLVDGEDYDYSEKGRSNSSTSKDERRIPKKSSKKDSRKQRGISNSKRNENLFVDESYTAIDYVFGMNARNYHTPKEIELKTIRDYQLFPEERPTPAVVRPQQLSLFSLPTLTTSTSGSSSGRGFLHGPVPISPDLVRSSLLSSLSPRSPARPVAVPVMRRNVSWRSILSARQPEPVTEELIGDGDVGLDLTDENAPDGQGNESQIIMNIYNIIVIRESGLFGAVRRQFNSFVVKLRAFYVHIVGTEHSDQFFFESIRVQPFSSGSYLRGMLVSGFSSLYFNLYNIAAWPSLTAPLGDSYPILRSFLYTCLVIQLILNIVQLPARLAIHFQCWESSRTVEVDYAIEVLRDMILGDTWLINRALGHLLSILGLINLLVTEVYLWTHPARNSTDDALRTLVVSLCATNLLTIATRVVCATVFSLSLVDPVVLGEARKRGLSKRDIDALETFVFADLEEVNNDECSICLSPFDIGEMLICLPCDKSKRGRRRSVDGIASLSILTRESSVSSNSGNVNSSSSGGRSSSCCSDTASQSRPAAHSFHAACIREWLTRQNSCPLCQKIVGHGIHS